MHRAGEKSEKATATEKNVLLRRGHAFPLQGRLTDKAQPNSSTATLRFLEMSCNLEGAPTLQR